MSGNSLVADTNILVYLLNGDKRLMELKLPDAFIAATSYNLQLPLITADKDFNSIKELSIIYYEK